jgi:HlyD family secretion protein
MKASAVQWRRRIVLGVLALLVASGLVLGFRPQPVPVEAGLAQVGPLLVTVEQEGRTRVVDRYVVTAPVNGFARRIRLEVGDPVRRGATLVELEPVRADALDARTRAEAAARIGAAGASVRAAEQRAAGAASAATFAGQELQRVRALRQSGYLAPSAEERALSEAERSTADLRSARFGVATARHELEAAQSALRYAASGSGGEPVRVRSPVDGRVLGIPRKSEGAVAVGQQLIEVGDPGALEAEVDVLSADAVRIRPGTRVLFERWGGDDALEGAVRVVEPAGFTKVSALGVEEQRVWVIVRFTSPERLWQRLGDRYRVEARFVLWEGRSVLQVPASALFRDGNGWALFAIEEGRAVKRRVAIGQRNGLAAQVLSGVARGQRVIVHPDEQVREGVAVAVRQE